MQRRFKPHYDVINYLRINKITAQNYYSEYETVCELNPLFKHKERASIQGAVLAVKRFKKEDEYSGTGLFFSQSTKITNNALQVFDVPYKTMLGVHLEAVGITVACSKSIVVDGQIKLSSLGHAVAFMKVLGNWFYYDDNIGFVKVDEIVVQALKDNSLRILHYHKAYFIKMSKKKMESVYKDGRWSSDLSLFFNENQIIHNGLYYYEPRTGGTLSIVRSSSPDGAKCQPTELIATSKAEFLAAVSKFKACIYANVENNSKIFENMYRYLYDNFTMAKSEQESLEILEKTVSSVVLRPACTPLTHYWCSKLKQALNDVPNDPLDWFSIPELKPKSVNPNPAATPPEFVKKLGEIKNEKSNNDDDPVLTPCMPGQRRNAKTKKCVDRVKPVINDETKALKKAEKEKAKAEKPKNATKKVKCEKGEVRDPKTGDCVSRKEPCPPGEVRDKDTKLCRPRMQKNPCPEGQVFDKKLKACRDKAAYKF